MHKIKTILKLFYFLLPRFVREQYGDSIHFYSSLIKQKIKNIQEGASTHEVTLVQEMNQLNCASKLLYEKRNRVSEIQEPTLYKNDTYIHRKKLTGDTLDLAVYALTNVSVIGWSDALICEDKMYHHELNHMEPLHDLKRHDIFQKVKELKNRYRITTTREQNIGENYSDSTIYISLLKEHSVNYYHWVTEGLPRLILIMKVLKETNYVAIQNCTILIDKGMPKQCIEAMEVLLPGNIKIKKIKQRQQFKCGTLIYASPLWLSLDNTKHLPNPKNEFFVDNYALKTVRESILKNVNTEDIEVLENKKIYLQRANTKLRAITNILEVEELLYKHGFDFIDSGSLSFREQLHLFLHADIIIGASGASFTNMLFMKEGCTAISFYPSAQSTNYYVFQPLADKSKTNFIHFLTSPEGNSNSVHADASVNVKHLDKLLKDISNAT